MERDGARLERRLRSDRQLVDAGLRRALREEQGVPRRLAQAMRYALLGGGKRLRPILALEAFRACKGGTGSRVMPFCCGLEMIHAFSLVHDDLPSMDNDDFRRGRPSLHRRFDEATAILAADGLLARGFGLIAECPAPEERVCRVVRMVARAIGPAGMTGGQFADVVGTHASPAWLARVHRLKTGELITVSLTGGAVLAGAGTMVERALRRAGEAIGALFQLTDDLLDETQPGDKGRNTMVACLGRDRTLARARTMATRARAILSGLGPRFELLALVPERLLERTA